MLQNYYLYFIIFVLLFLNQKFLSQKKAESARFHLNLPDLSENLLTAFYRLLMINLDKVFGWLFLLIFAGYGVYEVYTFLFNFFKFFVAKQQIQFY